MSEEALGKLRGVSWSELFPWLSIFRTFRLAVGFRMLLLGASGVLITLLAWSLLSYLLVSADSAARLGPEGANPGVAISKAVPDSPPLLDAVLGSNAARPAASWWGYNPFSAAWMDLSRPLWAALRLDATFGEVVYLMLCGLSALAIWAFFGGAITRVAAVSLAADEQVGLGSAFRYACSKWLSYFAGPLFPLAGVALAAVPVLLLGLIMRADWGVLAVGIFWPVLLLLGFVMALLLLGLVFGWPLMWSTISAEGTDSFDALSRSYAYVFQRPLHYLFYAALAGGLGVLAWILVENFAGAIIWLTYWAASWGSGAVQMGHIVPGGAEATGVAGAGAAVIHFWTGVVKLLALGFVYSYFWTAATAIYFLLRRDVDATEMDEVFLDVDQTEEAYGLSPITTDAAGAPAVGEPVPQPVPVSSTEPAGPSGGTGP